MDADVVVVGAGPTGLMLANKLCLAGVRTVVLECRAEPNGTAKAGGLSGQILQLLHYRGSRPAGADLRRGHTVAGLHQDDTAVTAEVHGPDGGQQHLTARFLVGCAGSRSWVRQLAGIPSPGVTYSEVQRLAQVTIPEEVTVLDGGDIDVAGFGRIPWGLTWTEGGLFAVSPSVTGDGLSLFTSEDEQTDYDDDVPMTVAELRGRVRRVLGADLPLLEATRLTRFTFHARRAETYRHGRILLAGDAAHLLPAPGAGLDAGLVDAVNLAWKLAAAISGTAPVGLLDTYDSELRPDAYIAWAAGVDEADETAVPALREALDAWFGAPARV